jgi:DNA primase
MGGDVFKFVQEIERISFYEALKQLAERAAIPIPRRTEYADAETKTRAAIGRMHEIAEQAYREALRSAQGAEARAYIARRGVGVGEVEQFGIGYAPSGGQFLTSLLQKEGFGAELLEQCGLVLKRETGGFYDRFRNRLMFPIHNESGKPIGFGGRALAENEQPKYMNSPETPIYRKSFVLYNLHRAKEAIRKEDRVVLVEGYMDVIGVYSSGVREVVASCGTALTTQQVQAMKRHSGRIVVNFDPDAAGANAAEKSLQALLDEGMQVKILELQGGLDPDEYCRERGADGYRTALDGANAYFHWLADRARSRYDMKTAEGRVAAFQFLLPAIHRIADKIERSVIAGDVAGYLGIDSGLVLENFRKAAVDRKEKSVAAPSEPVRHDEKILLKLFLTNEEARRELIPELKTMQAVEQYTTRRIFRALFALHDSGAPFGVAELDARLEEADRARLAAIVMDDEATGDEIPLWRGVASIEKLRGWESWERRVADLRKRSAEAERAGRLAEALQLIKEIDELTASRPVYNDKDSVNPRV